MKRTLRFEGCNYFVTYEPIAVQLPDGRLLGIQWGETLPPTILGAAVIEEAQLPPGAAPPTVARAHEYDNPRVSDTIHRGAPVVGYADDDYRALALAALDQAGVSKRDQEKIEAILAKYGPGTEG